MWIPRIGQEVIVDFLEGDPDRPLITGCVYNYKNLPPYRLPELPDHERHQVRSSKGGDDSTYNEIRLEDKKGLELFSMQAERDMELTVKRDTIEEIRRDDHATVRRDQMELVEKTITSPSRAKGGRRMEGDRSTKIDGDVSCEGGRRLHH